MPDMIWLEIAVLAIGLAALLFGPQRDDLVAEEWHHLYLGGIIFAFGWSFGWTWLQVVGLILTIDDGFQHSAQRWLGRPAFRSPLHRLYGITLYRLAAIRKFNQWLDGGGR